MSNPSILDLYDNAASGNFIGKNIAADQVAIYNTGEEIGFLQGTTNDFRVTVNDHNKTDKTASVQFVYEDNTWTLKGIRDDIYQWNLGNTGKRWYQAFFSVAASIGSDKRMKNTIEDITPEDGIRFITAQKPVSYYLNNENGGEHRKHYGLIAQDVEESMDQLGVDYNDFAGLRKDKVNNDYEYSLIYEEFISPLIASVKYLKDRNDKLEKLLIEKGVLTEEEIND